MMTQSRKVGWFSLSDLLGRARDALARRQELESLSGPERNALARELNLSEPELRSVARWPATPELLGKRLEHEGVSEDQLAASHGDVLRDLQRVCSQCSAKSRCAGDLDHARWASPAKYCPNELTIRALAAEPDSNSNTTGDLSGASSTIVDYPKKAGR